MSKNNNFRVAALAASIALAMGATSAMAATGPTATQLPGKGSVTKGTVTPGAILNDNGSVSQVIDINGTAVIDWGKGGEGAINADGTGGFNIGSAASLTFVGKSSAQGSHDGVLNVDSSGNASQIFGALQGKSDHDFAMNIFVANANGVIVGAGAEISSSIGSEIGLVGHAALATSDFNGWDDGLAFNGAGGDVVVQKGASIGAGPALKSVLVAGGNTVNVDLSVFKSGAVTLNAGGYDYNQKGGPASTYNDAASMSIAGSFGGTASIDRVVSGGDVSSSGTLDYTGTDIDVNHSRLDVAGTFTNTGTLTLIDGMTMDGVLVNKKTVNTAMTVNAIQTIDPAGITLGGLDNDGDFNVTSQVKVNGDLANQGQFSAEGVSITKGSLTNAGTLSVNGAVSVTGGDLTNAGTLSGTGDIDVTNGSIANNGAVTGFSAISTKSDDDFTAGADYSITNTGTMQFSDTVTVNDRADGGDNDTTGSFTNTGVLQVSEDLQVRAHDDIGLGGSVEMFNGDDFAAVSAKNPLSDVNLNSADGVLAVSTPIAFTGDDSFLAGHQVKLMANVSGGDTSRLVIAAGDKMDDDYAIRIGSGATVSANTLFVGALATDLHPNVILQGQLAAATLGLGGHYENGDLTGDYSVSDVFSGPTGGLVATGDAPIVGISFTGAVKSAKYLNTSNFRYNSLPITLTDADSVALFLNPVAYQTNGTSNGLSAVNILVNGSVDLNGSIVDDPNVDGDVDLAGMSMPNEVDQVLDGGSAVAGLNTWENTHLVLQSTGSIATSDFYWPGYVYLGTIGTNADGSAAPGTLGLGSIGIDGNFSNVLPGSLDNGGGIHFISQFPLQGSGSVETNGASWVNFGNDMLTQGYANGTLGDVSFAGGVQGPGNVVNYGKLDASMFHTHAPVATK